MTTQRNGISNANSSPTRRALMKGMGAVGAAGTLGLNLTGPAAAQSASVTAIMPGVFLPDAARPLLQKLADATVENAPYVSPTDTLAKLTAPGGDSRYDLMISLTQFVKGSALGAKAGDEKVMPLDLSLIPNIKHVMPLFKDDIITRDGKTYMIPLVWGYDSVIYDSAKIPPDDPLTQSWGVLFAEKYAGKVAWRDEAHQMFIAAGLHLGIADPVNMDEAHIKEVTRFLISKKKIARTMWSKFGEAVSLLASGEVYALYGWIPMRAALQKQGMKALNNWPSDGLLTWSQAGFIPKNAANAKAAHRVINAFLDKDFGQKLAIETQYPTTSDEVAALFSPQDRQKLGLDIVERKVKVYLLGWPAAMDRWLEAWNTVKSS